MSDLLIKIKISSISMVVVYLIGVCLYFPYSTHLKTSIFLAFIRLIPILILSVSNLICNRFNARIISVLLFLLNSVYLLSDLIIRDYNISPICFNIIEGHAFVIIMFIVNLIIAVSACYTDKAVYFYCFFRIEISLFAIVYYVLNYDYVLDVLFIQISYLIGSYILSIMYSQLQGDYIHLLPCKTELTECSSLYLDFTDIIEDYSIYSMSKGENLSELHTDFCEKLKNNKTNGFTKSYVTAVMKAFHNYAKTQDLTNDSIIVFFNITKLLSDKNTSDEDFKIQLKNFADVLKYNTIYYCGKSAEIIDIKYVGSRSSDIESELSNFSQRNFTIEGTDRSTVYKSFEGFLQSLKVNDKNKAKRIASVSDYDAKAQSKKHQMWKLTGKLYFENKCF